MVQHTKYARNIDCNDVSPWAPLLTQPGVPTGVTPLQFELQFAFTLTAKREWLLDHFVTGGR
jgi:hypothetical protein